MLLARHLRFYLIYIIDGNVSYFKKYLEFSFFTFYKYQLLTRSNFLPENSIEVDDQIIFSTRKIFNKKNPHIVKSLHLSLRSESNNLKKC